MKNIYNKIYNTILMTLSFSPYYVITYRKSLFRYPNHVILKEENKKAKK